MAIVRKSTRNLAIANRLRVSCAHKITKVSSSLAEMTFKGHSRSSEMSWFDRLHVICYYRSIVTMARLLVSFPTLYSQMLVENRTIYNPNCIQYINITGQHCCTTCGKSDQSNSKYRKKSFCYCKCSTKRNRLAMAMGLCYSIRQVPHLHWTRGEVRCAHHHLYITLFHHHKENKISNI